MARRTHGRTFRGGLDRWVTRDEAALIVAELQAVKNAHDLVEWVRGGASLAPRIGSTSSRAFIHAEHGTRLGRLLPFLVDKSKERATAADRREIAGVALLELAHRRREKAIWGFAVDRGIPIPVATGADGSGRGLGRCPSCDRPLRLDIDAYFYCRLDPACRAARAADVRAMLDGG
jgi:hypothetical protein